MEKCALPLLVCAFLMQGLDGSVKIHPDLCRLRSGLCWCEELCEVQSVPQSSRDPELWLPNRSCWGGGSTLLLSCGVSPGSSESPWGAALPWSSSTLAPVWDCPEGWAEFPPCLLQGFKEDNSQHRMLHLDLSIPPLWAWLSKTTGKQNPKCSWESANCDPASQLSLLHPQGWELGWALPLCHPSSCASCASTPCSLLWESHTELDTSWPVTDVHGPLHSGRISGYFPNVN